MDLNNQDLMQMVALRWMEMDCRPRIVIDFDLLVVWHNPAAIGLLSPVKDISLAQGRPLLSCETNIERLKQFVNSPRMGLKTLALPLQSGVGHLLLRGYRVPGTDVHCCELAIDHEECAPVLADFDAVFRLTKSEARIAVALFGGHSVSDVAKAHNVSIDTVRSHVRHIYNKLGTTTREQFFRRLQPFRVV